MRICKCEKELFNDTVPKEVRRIFKSVAYKSNDDSNEIKLRGKIQKYQVLVLVLRGQDIEGKIDQIYDREKLQLKQ